MTQEQPSPSHGPDPTWLPTGFEHPERVDLRCGMHLRPIRAADAEIDHPAVMGSRDSLWAKYGDAWGWPPADMTLEQDREDLAHHEREIAAHETFNYAVLDEDETRLFGCVYLDPRVTSPEATSSSRGGSSTTARARPWMRSSSGSSPGG